MTDRLDEAFKPDSLDGETVESDGETESAAKRRRLSVRQALPSQVLQHVGARRAELCGLSVPE